MLADDAPAELVAIFDWELSTIGDPLADVGYLTVTWAEPRRPAGHDVRQPDAVTRAEGFLTREEMIARYEERSGRSMSALSWYQALALWKAAVFMEGNYKRFQPAPPTTSTSACSTRGADARRGGAGDSHTREGPAGRLRRGAHHQRLRLVPRVLRGRGARPRHDQEPVPRGPARRSRLLRGLERGELDARSEFAERFGELLELEDAASGLVDRLFGGDPRPTTRCSRRCAAPRAGHPHRADLELLGRGPLRPRRFPELFDGVVISGDVGMHKPEPAIYELGCERVGLIPGGLRVRGRPARELRGRGGGGDDGGAPPRGSSGPFLSSRTCWAWSCVETVSVAGQAPPAGRPSAQGG